MCGLLSGALYRSDISNIKQWRFPNKFQSFSSKYLQPVLATPPIPRSSHTLPIQRPITAMSSALDVESLVASAAGVTNNNNNINETNSQRRRQSLDDSDDDNHSIHSISTSLSISSTSSSTPSLIDSHQRARHERPSTSTNSVREYIDALTGRTPLTQNEVQPPSQQHLRVLTTMFPNHTMESITDALSASHNNINRAVEIMLHTPIPNQNDYN